MEITRPLELDPQELAHIIYKSIEEKENLIKYLESLLTGEEDIDKCIKTSVIDLLERVKSGNYD